MTFGRNVNHKNMVNSLRNVILLIISQIVFGFDPCTQYEEIDEPLRSTGYIVKDKSYQYLLCDRVSLVAGHWYRFADSAQLSTSCVQEYHCGTNIPLWMNGAHPKPSDDIVSRQVCGIGGGGGNCCSYQDTVRVKNCGTFYVYELKPTRGCSIAYCAGTGVPCPPDMYSPTGNGTGCVESFPKLLLSPKLSNPIVKLDTFEFDCTVDFDPRRTDVGFDVEWLFDGHADPKVPKVSLGGTSRVTSMDQKYLEGHLGESVSCKVRAYFLKSPQRKGPFVSSNYYWCGIKMSVPRLEVGENEKPRQVQLISTIPIVCSNLTQASCKLEIYLEPNDHDMKLTTQCTQVLNASSWNSVKNEASVTFSVIAERDFKKDGDKILELNFQEIFTADAPRIFNNYRIPFLQITTKDKPTAMCWCTGDPHCSTFDTQSTNKASYYNYYQVGEFIMAKSTSRLFEVQVRTWKCGAVSCNCAVAAREGNDIVIIDMCQGTYGHTFPHLYIPHRGQMSQGTVVYQNTAGTEWLIDFPSGAQVKVDLVPNVALNLYVTVPEDDFQHTGGLCGYFDNNRDNDLTRPDGTTDLFPLAVATLENYTNSWRIPIGSSMFDLKENIQLDMQYDNNLYFCNCNQTNATVDCTINKKSNTPAVGTNMIAVVQGGQIISVAVGQGRRRQAGSIIVDDDVPPNYVFDYGYLFVPQLVTYPTATGKTKAQAEKMCTGAFNKSDAIRKCVSVGAVSLHSFIDMCVEDFKYFEEGAFVHTAKQAAIRSCSETVLKDPAFHDSKGKPPAFITSDLCPSDCSDRGACIQGVCSCNSGFVGDGCEINMLQPPKLYSLISTDRLGTSICDIRTRQCQMAFVSGNNFYNGSGLSCKVTELEFDGTTFHQTNKTMTTDAIYRTMFNLGCKLPTKASNGGKTVAGYRISVTNDGHVYSNELTMNRIDSLCLTCHMNSGSSYCNIKIHTCLIEGSCYDSEAINPANPHQKCDPRRINTQWTTLTTSTRAHFTTSTKAALTTSTKAQLTTSTKAPLTTSAKAPLTTSTNAPLTTSTKAHLTTGTNAPLTTSTHAPLTTGTNAPLTTSTNAPLTTSAKAALTTSINAPLTTSTKAPLTTNTKAPLTTGTNAPLTTSAKAALMTNTNAPLTTSTKVPLTTSAKAALTTNTNAPLTTSTNAPLTTSTKAPMTTSTNVHTSSTRPVAQIGGSLDPRFDIWTDSKIGCQCKGDPTSRTCACCEAGGCQCPTPNQFQCSMCANMSSCGNPQPAPEMGIDGYTITTTDCLCNFDKSLFTCACCQNGGCQCSLQHRNQCADCNHMDQCGSKPWIFGPPITGQ